MSVPQTGSAPQMGDWLSYLNALEKIALCAGAEILRLKETELTLSIKQDETPVCTADKNAEAIIIRELEALTPSIPIVAEEAAARGQLPENLGQYFYLVDALDGTKEFLQGRDDYTVNIALIKDGCPVAGVVYAPARNILFSASPLGAKRHDIDDAFSIISSETIKVRAAGKMLTGVASRSHHTELTEQAMTDYAVSECLSVGSSLKFCLIAQGLADIYPRFGRTMQWDTAAGDAIIRAAGGRTQTMDGQPLIYQMRLTEQGQDFSNPYFISAGCSSIGLRGLKT